MSDASISNITAPASEQSQGEEQSKQETPGKQPKETPEQRERRLLKAKINGKEVEVDEADVLRDYGKYQSADQKLREAAQMRKEVEQFYQTLLENPEAILNDPRIPLKKRELAMQWLTEQLQEELGEPEDPTQAELKRLQAELEQYKSREEQEKEEAEKAEYQQLVEQRREAIASTLSKAMQMSPLAEDPETQAEALRSMAMYYRLCKQAGYDVSPEEIAQHVEQQHNKSIQKLVRRLKGEKLIKYLGDDIINEVRRFDLQQLQKQREFPAPQQAESWEPRGEKPKREWVDPNELKRRR